MTDSAKLGIHLGPSCRDCKLNVADRSWKPGPDFNYSPKFLFIVEQFAERIPGVMRKLLRQCNFTGDYEIAYLVRCNCEGVKSQIREAQHCRPNLDSILKRLDANTVLIPMGAGPCKTVAKKSSILVAHGTIVEVGDHLAVPTYSPLQVINYPDCLQNFLEDLDKAVDASNGDIPKKMKTHYVLCDTIEKVDRALAILNSQEKVSFDIESTSLDPFKKPWIDPLGAHMVPKILTFNLSCKSGTGFVIPLDHKDHVWSSKERKHVLRGMRLLLENPDVGFCPHNGQFDMKYTEAVLGITVKNWAFDTLLAHYAAVTEDAGTHGLKMLAWSYTDMGGYDDELDAYKKEHPECDPTVGDGTGHYGNIPLSILWKYAAGDADCTFRLWEIFEPLVEEGGFHDLLYKILLPSARSLGRMENVGAPIDMEWWKHCNEEYPRLMEVALDKLREFPEVLKLERILTTKARKKKQSERNAKFSTRLEKILAMEESGDDRKALMARARLEADIRKAKERPVVVAPVIFNPASPQQKLILLKDMLKFTITKKTDSGELSTDKEVLKELWKETHHPIIQQLGKFTKAHTLYGMFVKGLDEKLGCDGRLRGGYLLFGTKTGRLSCVNPNLQQLPRNLEEEKEEFIGTDFPPIKKLFSAPPGWCIIQFDYSQAELRVLGSFANCKLFISAYKAGLDIHKFVASEVNHVPIEEVTKEERTKAKAVNFGLVYGIGPGKLAHDLGISKAEAKEYVQIYFDRVPEIKRYISREKAHIREHGWVRSPYGRLRRLASAFSPEPDIVAEAERQGVNAKVQCTASECTLMSINRMDTAFIKKGMQARAIITVHDSILALAPVSEAVRVYKLGKKIMESPAHFGEEHWLKVPMIADAEIGKNWAELKKVESVSELRKILVEDFSA